MTVTLQTDTTTSDSPDQRNEFKSSASTIHSLHSIFRRMNMFPRQDSFKYPDSTSPQVNEMMMQMCSNSQSSAGESNRTPALTDESASLASSETSGFTDNKNQKPSFRTSLLINAKLRALGRSTFRSPSNPLFRASIFSVVDRKSEPDVPISNSIHYHSYAPISETNNISNDRLQWIKSSPKMPVDIYVKQQNTRPHSRLSFFSAINWHRQNSLKNLNSNIGALNIRAHEIRSIQPG